MKKAQTRRQFLQSGGIMTAAGLASLFPIVNCNRRLKNPNILLICVDDLRPELGCYGKTNIHTPHLDGLAREGVLFSRHHIQAPTCGPSRYSLLTGLRPRVEAELNNSFMEHHFHQRPETECPETFIR